MGKYIRPLQVTSAIIRSTFLAGLLLILAMPFTSALAQSGESGPDVALLKIDGAITPVMAMYIERGIDDAVERGDSAVVIQMDTPGGLSSSMDDIIDEILASPIPVIVYVAPEGSRAASAGMYITLAAHVAAMAPVTNIGSATPVQLGGEESSDETAMDRKVVNDAAARARELAELRGRNAEWAEEAVRDAVNVGSREAAELNVIDFVASDLDEVLALADGREVLVSSGTTTVATENASVSEIEMSFFERVMQVLVDPNVAFIMLSLGTLGLIFELSNPGTIVPGVVGALMMILGFFALGTLESNAAGFALIALAFALFILEVFVVSGGLLTVGGLVAFIAGGLLLSNSNNPEVLQISRLVVFTVGILIALFFFFVVGSVARTFRNPPRSGVDTLVGQQAEVRSDLAPEGSVFLHGELWRAVVADDEEIPKGETVEVVERSGMKLTVRRPQTSSSGEVEASGTDASMGTASAQRAVRESEAD